MLEHCERQNRANSSDAISDTACGIQRFDYRLVRRGTYKRSAELLSDIPKWECLLISARVGIFPSMS